MIYLSLYVDDILDYIKDVITNLDFSLVHKLKNLLKIIYLHFRGHHHHGVGAGVLAEHHLEVGGGGTQDDLVCLDGVGGVLIHIRTH